MMFTIYAADDYGCEMNSLPGPLLSTVGWSFQTLLKGLGSHIAQVGEGIVGDCAIV